jgi:hypothetical protein
MKKKHTCKFCNRSLPLSEYTKYGLHNDTCKKCLKKYPKCSRKNSMHCIKRGEKVDDAGSGYVQMLEDNIRNNGGYK